MKNRLDMVRKAWVVFQPFRKHFAVSLSLLAVTEVLSLFSPYFIGQVLNAMQDGAPIGKVYWIGSATIAVTFLGLAIGCVRDQYELRHIDFTVANHLTNQTLEKVLGLSIGQHRSQNSGITQSVVSKGQNALHQMTFLLLYTILPISTMMIITVVMLTWFNAAAGIVVIAGILIYIWMALRTNRKFSPAVKELNDLHHRTNKHYTEILRHPSLILVQSQENRVKTEHSDRLKFRLTQSRGVWQPFSLRMWGNSGWGSTVNYAVLALGIYLVYNRGYGFGDFLILSAWTGRALSQLGNINRLQRQWLEHWSEAKKYFSLLEVKSAIEVVENPIRPEKFLGDIEFKNVSFTYPEQRYIEADENEKRDVKEPTKPTLPALNSVSFKIERGTKVAFVGESGAGKSTIVSLLTRSYDPEMGQILVDGHDLRLLDPRVLRKAMGVVEQNVVLFDGTLRYNLLFGLNGQAQDVTEEELERVSRLACIDRFQHRLTEGWDTKIGENGIRLSGGERQRVGIARALVKHSNFLIFDEATSNLDVENESLIKKAVAEASTGRTTIIIAHRLSTVRDVDNIFVMDRGNIVASGTHDELCETSPHYRNLVNKQRF